MLGGDDGGLKVGGVGAKNLNEVQKTEDWPSYELKRQNIRGGGGKKTGDKDWGRGQSPQKKEQGCRNQNGGGDEKMEKGERLQGMMKTAKRKGKGDHKWVRGYANARPTVGRKKKKKANKKQPTVGEEEKRQNQECDCRWPA